MDTSTIKVIYKGTLGSWWWRHRVWCQGRGV